jgi:hypothetical protein
MSVVTIVNKKSVSPDFMQHRIERRLSVYAELNNLDMIDALDKCIDVALMWHRTNVAVKSQLLKTAAYDFLKFYRS